MHRRSILQRGAALALLAACGAAHAADYPTKPVTMIVPQATGGTNDVVARIVAQKLGEALGGSVVVDNRPGAGGNIGTVAAARAAKDGYTLLMTISSAQAINPSLYKAPGFDPVKDFSAGRARGLGAERAGGPPVVPRQDARRLPQAGEGQAPQFQYASAGNGTLNHLLGEMLKTTAGIDMQHIPYKGVAPALNDLIGGQVPIAFASLPSVLRT